MDGLGSEAGDLAAVSSLVGGHTASFVSLVAPSRRATEFGYEPGNDADFERLYQASYGKILASLTVVLGDRAGAEDCAQDAFERAFKKWPTWEAIAPPEAWVHRIAINAALSYQRSRRVSGTRHLAIVGGDQDGDELDGSAQSVAAVCTRS